MSRLKSVLLYQDEPAGSLLKLIVVTVPAVFLVASIYLWSPGESYGGANIHFSAKSKEGITAVLELSTFAWVAIFAISAAIINATGILVIHKNKGLAEKLKPHFMCFAAGVLIPVPLLEPSATSYHIREEHLAIQPSSSMRLTG